MPRGVLRPQRSPPRIAGGCGVYNTEHNLFVRPLATINLLDQFSPGPITVKCHGGLGVVDGLSFTDGAGFITDPGNTSCVTLAFCLLVTCQIPMMTHASTCPDKNASLRPDLVGCFLPDTYRNKISWPIRFGSFRCRPKCHPFTKLSYTVCNH